MATSVSHQLNPSAYKLQHSSPLDSLVRRTSSRAVKTPASSATRSQPAPLTQAVTCDPQTIPYISQDITPPRQQRLSPSSPLLHSHFRGSTATASSNDNSSYLDTSFRASSGYNYQEAEYRFRDDESIYSNALPPSPTLGRGSAQFDDHNGYVARDSRYSWQSASLLRRSPTPTGDTGQSVNRSGINGSRDGSSISPVPTVVVSSADEQTAFSDYQGKAPIARPSTVNFSRPVRAPSFAPPLPSDEQKRLVLERNARRTPSPHPSLQHLQSNRSAGNQIPSTSNRRPSSPSVYSQRSQSPSSTRTSSPLPSSLPYPPPSPALTPASSLSPVTPNSYFHHSPSFKSSPMTSTSSLSPLMPKTSPDTITLSRHPPSLRATAPTSVYSTYSFYQLDDAASSPPDSTSHLHVDVSKPTPGAQDAQHPQVQISLKHATPQEFLQLGIQHHEANRLKESAAYFEKSAKESGGCGVGMLMWGLALRHGWGCEKNEKHGFRWLRKAAESAVGDLQSAREGMDAHAVKVCLFHFFTR